MSAEYAADLMKQVGTEAGTAQWRGEEYWESHKQANGAPAFGRRELLESFIIKPWFSQQPAAFKARWNNAVARCVASANDLDHQDDEECDEDGGD